MLARFNEDEMREFRASLSNNFVIQVSDLFNILRDKQSFDV